MWYRTLSHHTFTVCSCGLAARKGSFPTHHTSCIKLAYTGTRTHTADSKLLKYKWMTESLIDSQTMKSDYRQPSSETAVRVNLKPLLIDDHSIKG